METPQSVFEWANEVFPHRHPAHAFMKLFEEIGEYIRDPSCGEEWADILIMLWDLAVMHGIDPQSAIDAKMAKNRGRTWAINPQTGVAQHVE